MSAARVISVAATALAAVLFTPQLASAERVCHSVCNGGVCTERCVEREPSVEIRTEGRGHRHENWREERHDRRPGLEFRAPGVGIEIGR